MKKLVGLLTVLSGAALAIVVLANLADILAAEVWGAPLPQTFDITRIGMGISVFLALPAVFLADGNVRVDIVDFFLSSRGIRLLRINAHLATIVFLATLIWAMSYPARDAFLYGDSFYEIGVPHLVVWVPILAGAVISLVYEVIVLWRLVFSASKAGASAQ